MKILVLLASFLDTELPYTMQHCIENAAHPENVRFAIVLQHDNADAGIIDNLPYDIIMKKFHYSESQGVGWARHKFLELYNGEDYVLQVDSHSRFIKNWDLVALDNIQRLPSRSIISYLPWSYLKDKQQNKDVAYLRHDTPSILAMPNPAQVYGEYFVWYGGYDRTVDTKGKNIRIPFTYGGFVFAPGQWLIEVPPDPNFFYAGEEQSVYLRTYTNGWDIYMPDQNLAWHYSSTKMNPAPPSIQSKSTEEQLQKLGILSRERMGKFLAGKIDGIYGLGNQRSLEQWTEFSGVDFKTKQVIIKDYEQNSNA